MNKTVTVNLGGIVYHIDEDAYIKLDAYLNKIKVHFAASEGRDEIMADIESRVGEVFSEMLKDARKVVIISDVDKVIDMMGKPEDFADVASDGENNATEEESVHSPKRARRIFRDADNNIVGGVCSGIAAHFNFDPLILRIVFILSTVFFGTGLLVYIILWIVIPEAKTASEKLEMHGEQVNFQNIGKKINEEMESFKKKVDHISSDENKQHIKSGVRKFADFAVAVFGRFYHFFRVVVGIGLILFGSLVIAFLFASTMGDINFVHTHVQNTNISYSINELLLAMFSNSLNLPLLKLSLMVIVGIPLLSMIISGVKLLFDFRSSTKILSYTLLLGWVAGLVLFVYTIFNFSSNFNHNRYKKEVKELSLNIDQPIELSCTRNGLSSYINNAESIVRIDDWVFVGDNESYIGYAIPTFDIQQSIDSTFKLVLYKESMGASVKDAQDVAQEIIYEYAVEGNTINFNDHFVIGKNSGWKKQELKLKMFIPVGAEVYLDRSMQPIIYDIDNITNTSDSKMLGHNWKMTSDGLSCSDCGF